MGNSNSDFSDLNFPCDSTRELFPVCNAKTHKTVHSMCKAFTDMNAFRNDIRGFLAMKSGIFADTLRTIETERKKYERSAGKEM